MPTPLQGLAVLGISVATGAAVLHTLQQQKRESNQKAEADAASAKRAEFVARVVREKDEAEERTRGSAARRGAPAANKTPFPALHAARESAFIASLLVLRAKVEALAVRQANDHAVRVVSVNGVESPSFVALFALLLLGDDSLFYGVWHGAMVRELGGDTSPWPLVSSELESFAFSASRLSRESAALVTEWLSELRGYSAAGPGPAHALRWSGPSSVATRTLVSSLAVCSASRSEGRSFFVAPVEATEGAEAPAVLEACRALGLRVQRADALRWLYEKPQYKDVARGRVLPVWGVKADDVVTAFVGSKLEEVRHPWGAKTVLLVTNLPPCTANLRYVLDATLTTVTTDKDGLRSSSISLDFSSVAAATQSIVGQPADAVARPRRANLAPPPAPTAVFGHANRLPPPAPPPLGAAQLAATRFLVAEHAALVAERAPTSLLVGASLEHAAVIAGALAGGDEVRALIASDTAALEACRPKLKESLVRGLVLRAPRARGVGSEGDAAHAASVEAFVESLLQLLALSLRSTPLNAAGQAPADVVGRTPLKVDALSGFFHCSDAPHFHELRNAAIERDEKLTRERNAQRVVSDEAVLAAGVLTLVLLMFTCGVSLLSRVQCVWFVALFTDSATVARITERAGPFLLTLLVSFISLPHAYFLLGCPDSPEAFLAGVKVKLRGVLDVLYSRSALPTAQEGDELRAAVHEQLRVWGVRRLEAHLQALGRRRKLPPTELLLALMDDIATLSLDVQRDANGDVTGGRVPDDLTEGLDDLLREGKWQGTSEGSSRNRRSAGRGGRGGRPRSGDDAVDLQRAISATINDAIAGQHRQSAMRAFSEGGEGGAPLSPARAVAHLQALIRTDAHRAADHFREQQLLADAAAREEDMAASAAHGEALASAAAENARRTSEKRALKAAAAAAAAAGADAGTDVTGSDDCSSSDGEGLSGDASEGAAPAAAAQLAAPPRLTSVAEVLAAGGWTLARQRKHYVYKRTTRGGRTQTFTQSVSPSDWRASRAQLTDLRRLDAAAVE